MPVTMPVKQAFGQQAPRTEAAKEKGQKALIQDYGGRRQVCLLS